MLKICKKPYFINTCYVFRIVYPIFVAELLKKNVMKKLFALIFVAAAFAACGDASDLASAIEDGADQVQDAAADAADNAADMADDAVDASADMADDAADMADDAAADMDAAPDAE